MATEHEQQRTVPAKTRQEDIDWKEYRIHQDYAGGGDSDGDGKSINKNASVGEAGEENDCADAMFELFDSRQGHGGDDGDDIFEYKLPSVEASTAKQATTPTITLRYRSETSNSTGLGLWGGADLMCQYLVDHPELVRGKKSVLELGSGVGLCGIVAHHLGAKRVLMTDGDSNVLSNLRYNVQQNARANKAASSISCPQLIWGSKYAGAFVREYGRQCVVMASDCVYMTKSLVPLWETVSASLSLEEDAVFIYVNECASQVPLDVVLKMASDYGFDWEEPSPSIVLIRRRQPQQR